MQKIITLIGGSGSMGQLFAKYFRMANHEVRILDQSNWSSVDKLLLNCDLAIVCVPIDRTIAVISSLTNYLHSNTVLADFTSIKASIIQHMLKSHKGPVLGMHPMFGPTIISPQAQIIINCGGRDLVSSSWVIDSLNNIGFTIIKMEAQAHDTMMGFIQGIEHFSTFALGSFLQKQNQHPEQLFNLSSPIYQAKLALLGRIFDQDPSLYADIIMADKDRIDLIANYVNYLQSWIEKLKANKRDEFIQEFQSTSKWMGSFTHKAQLASDEFLTTVVKSFAKKKF